ncbi:MAG TPA: diacylglycerol kinase [Desulfuromonadales bacterium]|nr:diacylglycerol kinase [Desulfuromonadales bacterium]
MKNKFLGTGEQGYNPVRKVQNVISGLRYAVLTDFSVGYKLILSLIVLIATFALRQQVDLLLILIATGLVLITEIVNSAIEALCDFVEERHNEKIKIIKDIAAAAVGISIVVWVVVCAVEVGEIWVQFKKQ